MTELDDLAERAVATVRMLVRKGTALATGMLIIAACASAVCVLIAAGGLAGSARTMGLAIAIALAVIAVGASLLATLRLRRIGSRSRELVDEVRSLLERDHQARRTVVDTVEVQDATGSRSVVIWSRQFDALRQGSQAFGEFRQLNAALLAVTSFPGLLILSLLCALALGGLSLIYALAWLI